ncbi:MAG: hypothetical protein OEZ43_21730 [Gammaproteobacteria bacterium]|nr:hypothetical protein [Gammaproteobacteria bacterium]
MSDRFVRWQGYTMSQLTFVLNMFFGLSVAALAFAFSLVRDKDFILDSCSKHTLQICLVSLSIAVFSSCAAVVSRLFDYRFTAQKLRSDQQSEIELSAVYKYKSYVLGQLTWRLFWVQTSTMAVGLFLLVITVLWGYSDKIW